MKRYRTIYITQPAHDFSALAKYCQQIRFLTSGKEMNLEMVKLACAQNLLEFDPTKDAIVAVGKVNTSLLTGIALAQSILKGKPEATIHIGIYITGEGGAEDKDYRWEEVRL